MTDEPLDPRKEETEAIDRIARSSDGPLLHRYLRRTLEAVFDAPDSGALLSHNGRRTFARDLMRLMAPGIEANSSGGRTDQSILTGTRGTPVRASTREQRIASVASFVTGEPADAERAVGRRAPRVGARNRQKREGS